MHDGGSADIRPQRGRTWYLALAVVVVATLVVAGGVVLVVLKEGPPTDLGAPPAETPSAGASLVDPPVPAPALAVVADAGAGDLADVTLPVDWTWGPSGVQFDPRASFCASGEISFVDGLHLVGSPPEMVQRIVRVARADVDRDGTEDLLAELQCGPDSLFFTDRQLVAYRQAASGRYAAIGVVAVNDHSDRVDIDEFGVDPAGLVQVRFVDKFMCCDLVEERVLRQWRGFSLTGGTFALSAGPSSLFVDPSVATVDMTVPDLTLPPENPGVLVITLHNQGPQPVPNVTVAIVHSAVRATDDGWDGCDFPTADRSLRGVLCPAGTLAVGQTVQLRLQMVYVPTFGGQFLVEARSTGLVVAMRHANVAGPRAGFGRARLWSAFGRTR